HTVSRRPAVETPAHRFRARVPPPGVFSGQRYRSGYCVEVAFCTDYSRSGRRGGARAVAFGASRYDVLLTFGASYSVGAQMASVSVVLPFLLAEKGVYWAAGLLYPTFSIGFIAGNALSPLVVERSRRRQNAVIAAAAATIAVLTSCIAAAELRDAFVAPVFLSASLLIGCAMGMANNAY